MGRDCRLPCDATRTLAPCEANAWYQRTYHATYLLPWHGGLATHHGEQSNNAYNFMCQLQGLIVQPVMPDFCKYGKCQSLYIQGYHAWTTGLSVKPQFPQQSQLFELMHGLLATRRANLEPLPPVNLCFVDERWPEDMEETYFNERARRSRLAMIKVRKRRKISWTLKSHAWRRQDLSDMSGWLVCPTPGMSVSPLTMALNGELACNRCRPLRSAGGWQGDNE